MVFIEIKIAENLDMLKENNNNHNIINYKV